MEVVGGTVILILTMILCLLVLATIVLGTLLYMVYKLKTNPDKDETQEENKRI